MERIDFFTIFDVYFKTKVMVKGNLKLLDKKTGLVEFTWNKYFPQSKQFIISGDTIDLFYRWFWSGSTTACICEKNERVPDLGWGKQMTVVSPDGLKLTAIDKYEFLRYKGTPTKISFQIEHVLCV